MSSFIEGFFDIFVDRYVEEPMSGCWLWHASQTSRGYGNLTHSGRSLYAHRCSFEAVNGEGSADGLVVRHRCDNPSCINPLHLVGGTHAENMDDAWRRGRMNPPRGEQSWRSSFKEADVILARQLARDGVPICEIARRLGKKHGATQCVITGETWAHVPGPVRLADVTKKKVRPPHVFGENSPRAILTTEKVLSIRARLSSGETGRSLAKEFGVTPATISAIKKRRYWSHV